MTISNPFLVRIVADTELGRTAAATSPGSFSAAMSVPSLATPVARLDPSNEDGTDYPDCSGGTTTNGYSITQAWIWGSKVLFDTTTRRVLFVCSPASTTALGVPGNPAIPTGLYNGYNTLLTTFDEADNDIHVYESPFSVNNATWPRSVGHAFDNQCLVGRTLYKMTSPVWISGQGYVQPQVTKIDIDQVTDAVSSAREGEAYLGSINAPWEWDESALTWQNPGQNITAGALDYLPGSDSLVFFHKKWLSFCPVSTGVWTQPVDLNTAGYGFDGTYVAELSRTTWPFHNVGHYNAASGKFICGGGAYNPDGASNHRYQLDWISVDATTQAITKLDDSPVIMSVSETDMPTTEPAHLREAKVAACAGPNSVESLFFHDNGNVYGLNPFRPPGYQWRVVTTLAFEVDLCVPIDDYGVVLLFTSGANGTASMRVYKPPVAGDHTPPSIPLDVAATATSSSEITVTWSASTDPVIQGDTTSGVAGYRVYRNGTLVTPGPVGLVTSFNDTGLTQSTLYGYRVSAVDADGNESSQSAEATATTDSAATLYFSDGFESGGTSAWSAGGDGTPATVYVTGGAGGTAYAGTRFIGWTLTNGSTANDYGLYRNYGTAGQIGTQIRDCFVQFAVSHGGTFGLGSGEQKLCIVQYYRTSSPSFSNAYRKYQVIPCVLSSGVYAVAIVEMDDAGSFLRNAFCYQSGTTYGPASAANQWDTLRLEVQLDTNGSAVGANYGPGFGNGVIRLWRNNTLIIEETDVNICRGETVGMGRFLLTPSHQPHTWTGTTASIYYDGVEVGSVASALTDMPATTRSRVSTGNNNPDSIPAAVPFFSKDYSTQLASDITATNTMIIPQWGANYGYGGTGGWRAQVNPGEGAGPPGGWQGGDGWIVPDDPYYFTGNNGLLTISFMLKITATLLNNWGHNGFLTALCKMTDMGDASATRIGFHFGWGTDGPSYGTPATEDDQYPQFVFAGIPGGNYCNTMHDWRQHADQWVWVCQVIDGRAATSAGRYLAIYIKPEGASSITRIGRWYENQGMTHDLSAPIISFQRTPLWGYWDDVNYRENVESLLSQMHVYIDRVRIALGWPSGSDGPPF